MNQNTVRFYDLLGVTSDGQANALLESYRVRGGVGITVGDSVNLADYLQKVLMFTEVHPGVGGDRVGLSAKMEIKHDSNRPEPISLVPVPTIGFVLRDSNPPVFVTPSISRIFVTQGPTGTEIVIDKLKVEIRVPTTLLQPLYDEEKKDRKPDDPPGLKSGRGEVTWGGDEGDKGDAETDDGLKVVLRDYGYSSIFVTMKVRMTEEKDFILEPAVPISIGACRFLGLPCDAVHDLGFLPTRTLLGDHSDSERALEWTRHSLGLWAADVQTDGIITARTVDLSASRDPMKTLIEKMNGDRMPDDRVDLVLEDLAIPINSIASVPIPCHGAFGIRRKLKLNENALDAFGFDHSPISVKLGPARLLIENLFIRTVADIKEESPILLDLRVLLGEDGMGRLDSAIVPSTTEFTVSGGDTFPETKDDKKPGKPIPFEVTVYDVLGDPGAPPGPCKTGVESKERMTVEKRDGNRFTVKARNPEKALPHCKDARVVVSSNALGLEISDEWTVAISYSNAFGLRFAKLFGASLKLWGMKVGVSIRRLASKVPEFTSGEKFLILVDFSIELKRDADESGWVEIKGVRGASSEVVLRNVGWNLGSMSWPWGQISLPEGLQIVICKKLTFSIEEIKWVSENNGAQYFSFTGGIAFFRGSGSDQKDAAKSKQELEKKQASDSKGYGGGIRVIRLRGKTGGNPEAPGVMLDGVSLELRLGVVEIEGFGMKAEFDNDEKNPLDKTDTRTYPHHYEELGFGLKILINTGILKIDIAAFAFYGTVSGKFYNYTYWMVGANVSPIPCGVISLIDIQALVASNLTPDLPIEDPDAYASHMQLFNWYKLNRDNLFSIQPGGTRVMKGWKRQDNSLAVGAGLGVSLPVGNSLKITAFVFYYRNPADEAFMILLEFRAFKIKKPIAFGVMDYNLTSGAWGVMLGVDFDLLAMLSDDRKEKVEIKDKNGKMKKPFEMKLTGTLYFGNPPFVFSIGKLWDQDTWLTFKISYELQVIEFLLLVAFCMEMRDVPEGPKGIGILFTFKGGGILGIGSWSAYIGFCLIAGQWRNESVVRGLRLWIEAALRFKVFFIFNIGVLIRLDIDYLDPKYTKIGFLITLELPWFLPNITFRVEKIWNNVELEKLQVVSSPLITASAVNKANQISDLALTSLEGAKLDPAALYTPERIRELREVTEVPLGQLDALKAVSIDSTIAIDFKCSVNDRLTLGENTPSHVDVGAPGEKLPDDAGTQKINLLSVNYDLVSIRIERKPRFNPLAAWTTILSESDTKVESLEQATSTAKFDKTNIALMWDRDLQRDGKLDPRRMLINAEMPFSFVSSHPKSSERNARGGDPWPCCLTVDVNRAEETLLHRLDFDQLTQGTRVASFQTFSDSNSTLHWLVTPLPLVVRPGFPPLVPNVVRHWLQGEKPYPIAVVMFDQPVCAFFMEAFFNWSLGGSVSGMPGELIVEALDGLSVVWRQTFDLKTLKDQKFDVVISLPVDVQTNWMLVRYTSGRSASGGSGGSQGTLEVKRCAYLTVEDRLSIEVRNRKCDASDKLTREGGGKFAWLPNHHYRIRVETKITLRDDQTNSQTMQAAQLVQFMTKGLIGLNAVDRVGGELELYVESLYPGASPNFLYRTEAAILAFNEKFNILSPLHRHKGTYDEHLQRIEWVMAVDKLEGDDLAEHVSQTSADWFRTNYARFGPKSIPAPPPPRWPVTLSNDVVNNLQRDAAPLDALRQRYDTALRTGCRRAGRQTLPSQVMTHQPVASRSPFAAWHGNALYRANVRLKNAPFIEWLVFDKSDHFTFEGMGESLEIKAEWRSDNGLLRIGDKPEDKPADNLRRYALAGEPDWNFIQVRAQVDPQGGQAGVAIGASVFREVEGDKPLTAVVRAALAVIEDGKLKIIEMRQKPKKREEGGGFELEEMIVAGPKSVGEGSRPPYLLEVFAYDDILRVRVGEVQLEAPRTDIREGYVALVNKNGGAFSTLAVEGLDAYRFEFLSSRFFSFGDHIDSFDGNLVELPALVGVSRKSVGNLLSQTSGQMDAVMTPGADREQRQRVFDHWVKELVLPLRAEVERIELSRVVESGVTGVLLLESPEPLPFSTGGVSLGMNRSIWKDDDPAGPPSGRLLFSQNRVIGTIHLGSASLRQPLPATIWLAAGKKDVSSSNIECLLMRLSRRILDGEGRLSIVGLYDKVIRPWISTLEMSDEEKAFNVEIASLNLSDNEFALVGEDGKNLMSSKFANAVVRIEGIKTQVLTNGAETRAIIIPMDPTGKMNIGLASGFYGLDFSIERARYRSETASSNSVYEGASSVRVSW